MAKKTPRVYTLDKLKEKSQKALDDPKLVEIVKSTPLNKNGKVNCTWAYEEAEKYVHEQTKDLQKTKELAVATRFLAMLRRDFAEDFEKLVSQKEQPKPPEKKKKIDDILLNICVCGIKTDLPIGSDGLEVELKFRNTDHMICGIVAALDQFRRIPEIDAIVKSREVIPLRDMLIWILEEKFGLKVVGCHNCGQLMCMFRGIGKKRDDCKWIPREVSIEKKEK